MYINLTKKIKTLKIVKNIIPKRRKLSLFECKLKKITLLDYNA